MHLKHAGWKTKFIVVWVEVLRKEEISPLIQFP